MHFVYIIYSVKLNRYYTGETHDVPLRLERHNSDFYKGKWSSKGKPWKLFLLIECEDRAQAQAIERHIKTMKSRKYIENLDRYPEMISKLKTRFPPHTNC